MLENNRGTQHGLRTWVEIDSNAIKHNYNLFRQRIDKETMLMAVVKSNAYGHDLVPFAKEVEGLGVDWIAVDSIVEGLKLRREGVCTPILVLGHTLKENLADAALHDISVTVSNLAALKDIDISALSKKLHIHIKCDTGMHRQGFMLGEEGEVLKVLDSIKDTILVEGLYTHFAAAKNPAFPQYVTEQLDVFNMWINLLKDNGFNPLIHAAATGGTILFPESHFDMVRVGIGMYGLWPSVETESYAKDTLPLKQVLTWKTVIGEIKNLPEGAKTGYDLTETMTEETKVAICPVGYWHGFPRALSSIGQVLIGGERARVIGRVSMDMIVVDISGISDTAVGSEVVLLGSQKDDDISAEFFGRLAGSCNYEIVTRINPRIKRIYRGYK